jgi:hypothetical protein
MHAYIQDTGAAPCAARAPDCAQHELIRTAANVCTRVVKIGAKIEEAHFAFQGVHAKNAAKAAGQILGDVWREVIMHVCSVYVYVYVYVYIHTYKLTSTHVDDTFISVQTHIHTNIHAHMAA